MEGGAAQINLKFSREGVRDDFRSGDLRELG